MRKIRRLGAAGRIFGSGRRSVATLAVVIVAIMANNSVPRALHQVMVFALPAHHGP